MIEPIVEHVCQRCSRLALGSLPGTWQIAESKEARGSYTAYTVICWDLVRFDLLCHEDEEIYKLAVSATHMNMYCL
jgi:hypothetical protein